MSDGPLLPPPPRGYESRPASRPVGATDSPRLPDDWSSLTADAGAPLGPDAGGGTDAGAPARGHGFRPNDIFLGLGLSAAAFFITFGIGIGIFEAIEPDPTENDDFVAIAIIVVFVDLFALILAPFFVLRGRDAARLVGLRAPTIPALGWGLAALIASWISLAVYQVIIDAIDVEALEPVSAIDGDDEFTVLAAVLTGVAVMVMAPISEEIFHRGFLVGAIARRFGVVVGVVVSAAIFSALHFDVGSLIPFFLVGVIFAVAYVKSGNLWASISAHFVFNLVAFIVTVTDRGIV